MKKIIFIIFISNFIFSVAYAQRFYALQLKNSKGNIVPMPNTPDKPVFIWMTDLESTNNRIIALMDSVALVNNNRFSLYLLPVIKQNDKESLKSLIEVATKMKFDLVIEPIVLKNNRLANSHPILSWLSDKNKNKHFEIKEIGVYSQFLLVGKDGTLKGHIADVNNLPASFVPQIINRFVTQ